MGETARMLRPFVITTYSPDASGVLVPVLPVQCIAFVGAATGACDLRPDHRRPRKTGPCFALTVIRCATHGSAFTLYPPGHVPHGRVAIAPISSTVSTATTETTTELLFSVDDSPLVVTAGPSRRALDWRVTLFDAALDAVEGQAWSRAPNGTQPKRWRTQVRRLALCALILGLRSTPEQCVGMAETLGIAPLALCDASKAFAVSAGFRSRGLAVCNALGLLTISRSLGDRLMIAGARGGCWGEPVRCDPRSGLLLALSRIAGSPP